MWFINFYVWINKFSKILEVLFLIKFLFKFTFFLFFFISYLTYSILIVWGQYEEYFLVTEYLYCQECWGDWDINSKDVSEPEAYILWENVVSGLSDNFWDAWDDKFYPWDNYLYPEFRFFFVFTDTIVDFWI